MLLRGVVTFAVLLATASLAHGQTAVNIAGTWSGQFALTKHCGNSPAATETDSGIATASFSESGGSISGSYTFWINTVTQSVECANTAPRTVTGTVTGFVTGTSFAGMLDGAPDPEDPGGNNFPFSGSADSGSIALVFSTGVSTGTMTLSRSDSRVDLTGTWSGTSNETVSWSSDSGSCSNPTPAPISSSGPVTLAIAQDGPNFLGSMTFPHNWHAVDPSPQPNVCALVDSGPGAIVVSGVVSGPTIIASTLPLSLSGTTITFTFPPDKVERGSFTLTREASTPVGGTLTGTWSGTMNETFTWPADHQGSCHSTPAPFTTSLQSTLAIAQNGSSFSGALTFPHLWSDSSDGNGNCIWVDNGTYAVTVSGTISGSTITGTATGPNADTGESVTTPLILSVSGSTITGSFQADNESASFTLTKQGPLSRRRAVER